MSKKDTPIVSPPIELTTECVDHMQQLLTHYKNEDCGLADVSTRNMVLFTYWNRMEDSQLKAALYTLLVDLEIVLQTNKQRKFIQIG